MKEGDHKSRNVRVSRNWKKRGTGFILEPLKECSPVDTLIVAGKDQFLTSNLQNCKIINLCCLKPKFVVMCYGSNRKLLQNSWHNFSLLFCASTLLYIHL